MMNWSDSPFRWPGARLTATLLSICAAGPAMADWPPPAYEAVYDIYADGKLSSETRVIFKREGDTWSLSSQTQGIKGLARFLGLTSHDSGRGGWRDGSTLPTEFSHEAKVTLKKDSWSAVYDWPSGMVATRHEEGESSLAVTPGTVDPAALTLELQARLNQGLDHWEMRVVDEDEIDQHQYAAGSPAPLQTALGCLEAIEVRRIRENSKRYTSFWAASDLHFIPIRMTHGKTDGHELDSRLRTLTIAGTPVAARADCPAPN